MVTLPGVSEQSSGRVLDSLKLLLETLAHTTEDTVAIIEASGDKGVNHRLQRSGIKKLLDLSNTMQLAIGPMTDVANVSFHGQVGANDDTYVPGRV